MLRTTVNRLIIKHNDLKRAAQLRHNFHSNRSSQKRKVEKSFPYGSVAVFGTIGAFVAYDSVNGLTYCGAVVRFLRSVKTASLIAFDYFLTERHHARQDYELLLKATHLRSAERLLETCLLNGGLYIKVGQGIAAINHILPKEYTSTLSLLQDECLKTTRSDVEQLFLEDFGRLPEKVFAEFDYEPVAAASLAQVFKAKLKSGEQVAVKVQYIDLKKRFTSDLGTIIFLHDLIDFFFKNYNFGWILENLRENLMNELDFIKEADNAEKCAEHLKKFKYVHVPKVYWDVTQTRVLTMEWIDGFKISNMNEIKQQKLNVKDIDIKLFKMFSEQIFNTGFVHADPHPGNILVRKNPETGKADLVLLDHGLYENIPEEVRLPLCEFWEASVLKDEHKMEAAAKRLGIKDYMKFAEVLFQQPLRLHGGTIKTKLTEKDIEHMQEMARKNFDLIMDTLKEMPRNMLFVVRNLNTIRAISRQHGDKVDRTRVMARYAQRCIYSHSTSFVDYFRWICRRALFEYYLFTSALKKNSLNLYFNILYKLGRAPAAARTLLRDLTSHDLEYDRV